MTIYIDSEYKCHLENADGRRAFETDKFDGMSKPYIEGFIYIPDGETWVRSDGEEFKGIAIFPYKPLERVAIDVATSYLDDEQAESVTILFEEWQPDTKYEVGDRRQYNGLLYRCVQGHTSQDGWEPPNVPALWVRTWTDEWPEWIQPISAADAYSAGDKVSHNEKHWISSVDANVWEPGIYGWDEAE